MKGFISTSFWRGLSVGTSFTMMLIVALAWLTQGETARICGTTDCGPRSISDHWVIGPILFGALCAVLTLITEVQINRRKS